MSDQNPQREAAIRRATADLATSLVARDVPPSRAAQVAAECRFDYDAGTGQLLVFYGRKEGGDALYRGLSNDLTGFADQIATHEKTSALGQVSAAESGGTYDPVADGKARAAAEKKRNDTSLAFK